jgi:MSHA pilin protein MshC
MTEVRGHAGFTIAELAVTIAVIGILSFSVIPALSDRLWVDARGHSDKLRAMLQYAQNFAIAQRRNVCVSFAAGTATVQKAATAGAAVACTVAIMDPVSGTATYSLAPAGGVTVTPSVSPISFDALGATAATATVSVGGGGTPPIVVEGVTGYVH